MSENSTNTTVNHALEPIDSAGAAEGVAVEIMEEKISTSTDSIYEMAEVPEETPKKRGKAKKQASKKKNASEEENALEKEEASKKKRSIFSPKTIGFSKLCNAILILLGNSIVALCLAQIIFWGLRIKDTYLDYWKAIRTFDYINIVMMAFIILFVLVLVVHIIKSIVSLMKSGHELQFEIVSTLLAFYIFTMFVTKLFRGTTLLISNFTFEPLLNIILVLVLAYALFRLFVKDFGARIWPIAFSGVAIILSIIMFTQNAGNFAEFTIDGVQTFQLSDLNIYRYINSVIDFFLDAGVAADLESKFLACGTAIRIKGIVLNEEIIVILLQFVSIMVSNLLPFAAISLLGYLGFGLVGGNHIQYYNLQNCKKVSVTMLVVSIFHLASTIGLYFICKLTNARIAVQIDYVNIVMTMALCILMIIATSLPWKIYHIIYKHHYAVYKKSEGSN